MARFRYRMQAILDLKYKTESQAKNEFGAAQRALNDEEDKLVSLYDRKEKYFADGVKLRESASLPVRDIMQNDTFLDRMDELIELQKQEIQKAERIVEEKREILMKEIQERKMQEKLRERAFEQYMEDERKAESMESDQRSSFVYGQRA